MKAKHFDVVIVGAGPAGMFAAHELVKKSPGLKVALVDRGKRVENRSRKDVLFGIGGSGTFSDGKLVLSAVLSHERAFHLIKPEKYRKILDYVDEVFTSFGVDCDYFPKNTREVRTLVEEAQKNDMKLVVRKYRHVGTDKLKEVVERYQNFLEEKGVQIIPKTQIEDVIVENKKCIGVKTADGEQFFGDAVLLAPGRGMARWLQETAEKYGVKYFPGMVEVGVRVEFPSFVMRRHAEALYEPVLKVRTKTYDDIVRTFCACPNGLVATEKYDGYVCVNGHSNSDHKSPNSNFALLNEINLTEPVENTVAYAKSIAEVASTIGGGKPILQRFVDFERGRRSTWGRLKKSFVEPSLTEVTPGDISMALPHRIVTNLTEALEQLDLVMPGINAGSTLLYAPEVKLRSSKIQVSSDMQTDLRGMYVAGDASGLSGMITGAAVTGIMAARGILARSEVAGVVEKALILREKVL